MKQFRYLIIGLMLLLSSKLLSQPANADGTCGISDIDTHYEAIYCGIRLGDNESADQEIAEVLSSQFGMDAEIIIEILDNTICQTVADTDEGDLDDYPEAVRNSCLPSGSSTEQVLGGWSIFTDIRNAYEKEKSMQLGKKSLKFKFAASEQYWDGEIASIGDAPFDLIVDLNLIEIVLFGSKAQWLGDVFTFPAEDTEEAGEAEQPLVDGPPEDEEEPEDEGFEETPDPGLEVAEEGQEGELPPGCVPPDDPNANPNANPLCGNGTLDVLMGETCDDGNKQSGDGCSQACQAEEAGSGDQCIDPEAVTFKEPGDSGAGDSEGSPEDQCPPGSVPSKLPAISGTPAGAPQEVQQAPEYPGPHIGGTLKQFPASNQPPCGPGESPVSVTVAGETHTATDEDDEVVCLPTELCADFNAARDFLFGEGWEDDDVAANIAPAIESLFCVDVIERNRPLSPYQLIEGCIDCHITAMVDALEKALQTNVSPLVNTTAAFQISSKYGPNFSFNLNTVTKSDIKYKTSNTKATALKRANEQAAQTRDENTKPPPKWDPPGSPLSALQSNADEQIEAQEKQLEDNRFLKLSSGAISDQEVGGRIIPLINQMRDSFSNIQSVYEQMIASTALDEKNQCIIP